jgi:hypothetical protein
VVAELRGLTLEATAARLLRQRLDEDETDKLALANVALDSVPPSSEPRRWAMSAEP